MKVTLTGAAGRLGIHACRALIEAGHTVRATDRVVRPDYPIRIEVADLRVREASYGLLEGADAVVHLGNHATFRGYDSQTVFNENTTINMNVFQAAAELKVGHVVFASTVQVISGEPPYHQAGLPFPYLPLDAATPPNPGNAYALSKRAAEVMLEYFSGKQGLNATAVRFPYLVDDNAMAWLRTKPDRSGSTRGEGYTFLHMRDAAALAVAILQANLTGYHLYFPASRDNSECRPAADVIRDRFAGIELRRPLEQISSLVDLSAIERDTGWTPRHSSLA